MKNLFNIDIEYNKFGDYCIIYVKVKFLNKLTLMKKWKVIYYNI